MADLNEIAVREPNTDFTDEVLRGNGLGDIANSATLIDHGNGNSVLIPENTSNTNSSDTTPTVSIATRTNEDSIDVDSIIDEIFSDDSVSAEYVPLPVYIPMENTDMCKSVLGSSIPEGTIVNEEHVTENLVVKADLSVWTTVWPEVCVGTLEPYSISCFKLNPDLMPAEEVEATLVEVTPTEEVTTETSAVHSSRSGILDVGNRLMDEVIAGTSVLPTTSVDADNEAALVAEATSDIEEMAIAEALGTTPAAVNEEVKSKELSAKDLINMITPNPTSIYSDETTTRFSGAAWFKAVQQSSVIVAGQGGIGSWITMLLSRMKPQQVFIYDDDEVERLNLAGQLYSKQMIGSKKVDAMATLAKDFSEYFRVMAIPTKFTYDANAGDIMICGFDNMEARKTFFNVWLRHVTQSKHPENCLFIDGRLALEEFQVFCIQGNDTANMTKYSNEYLFSDYEAEEAVCSMKQTAYCASMIGSIIVNLYTNFIANTLKPLIDRSLPFKTYYSAEMMYLKTEF